jgi:hypothetical protein
MSHMCLMCVPRCMDSDTECVVVAAVLLSCLITFVRHPATHEISHNNTMNSPYPYYGAAPIDVHFCPNCLPSCILGKHNHPPGQHPRFPSWALELLCPSCKCLYTICRLCTNQRKPCINKDMILRHNRLYHVAKQVVLPSRHHHLPITTPNHTIPSPSSHPTRAPNIQYNYQDISPASTPGVQYTTQRSTTYFQHHVKDGNGPTYLTSKSIFQIDHTFSALTLDDVSLNLLLGHLVILLPDKPRKMLCLLLQTILSRTSSPPLSRELLDYKPRYHISALPTHFPALRRQFLKGVHAMFPCLPTPKISSLGNHAYCLPSDCLQHHLSYGYKAAFLSIPPDIPTVYSHAKYSQRCLQIASRKLGCHSVAAIMWSDDCDPQNSKKNRKALWCLTITFIQDPRDGCY